MKEKITANQLIFLIGGSRTILSLIYLPTTTSPPNNQDLWITAFFYPLFFILLVLPVYFLWKRHPNETIIQSSQALLGKMGILVGLLYVWYFLDLTAINVVDLTFFYSGTQMPETPNLFFIISLVLCTSYAVYKGIEVISRFSEFLFPFFVAMLIIFSLLLLNRMDLDNLHPFLEDGILPVLHGALISAAFTPEITLFSMLLPCLNTPGKAKFTLLFTPLLIAFLALLIALSVVLVFGAKHAADITFPYYDAIRVISIGDFIERIESIHLSFSVLGIFIKIATYFYLTVLSLSQTLKLCDSRPLIIPIGVLIIVYCPILGTNLVEFLNQLSYRTYTWYNVFFISMVPTILLIISYFKQKGESS